MLLLMAASVRVTGWSMIDYFNLVNDDHTACQIIFVTER